MIFSNELMLFELLLHSKNTWLGPVSASPAHCLTSQMPLGFYTVLLTGFVMDENRTLEYFRHPGNFRPSYTAGKTLLSFLKLIQNYTSKSSEYEGEGRKTIITSVLYT